MTTVENVTEDQLCKLRDEASQAGDFAMVEVCNRALAELERPWEGTDSIAECVRVINDAAAQVDADP